MNTAQQLTQQINQAIQKIEKEKVILEAEFINATPWWGKGPTGKMIENINGKRIYSLPTAKTIIGKTRWVMATYLSPYVCRSREDAENIISRLLGSVNASGKVRIIVSASLAKENEDLIDYGLAAYDTVVRRIVNKTSEKDGLIKDPNIPFAPHTVSFEIKVIERMRLTQLEKDFLLCSLIAALAIYGIGGRANRGYGRFVPIWVKSEESCCGPRRFVEELKRAESGVHVAGVFLKIIICLEKLAAAIASGANDNKNSIRCREIAWPLPPMATVEYLGEEYEGAPIYLDASEITDGLSYQHVLGAVSMASHAIAYLNVSKRGAHKVSCGSDGSIIGCGPVHAAARSLVSGLRKVGIDCSVGTVSKIFKKIIEDYLKELTDGDKTSIADIITAMLGTDGHLTLLIKALTGLPKYKFPGIGVPRRQSPLVTSPVYSVDNAGNISYTGVLLLSHYPPEYFEYSLRGKPLVERLVSSSGARYQLSKKNVALVMKSLTLIFQALTKTALILLKRKCSGSDLLESFSNDIGVFDGFAHLAYDKVIVRRSQ